MVQEHIKSEIDRWLVEFVEVPHPALGNWSPCPFARRARLNGTVGIFEGTDPYFDLKSRARWGMGNYEVIIYAYDPVQWPHKLFNQSIESANQEFLLVKDLLALEDHPSDLEIVNGVCMNQGTYALALVQSLSDLNVRAKQLANKGFYHNWPEDYLQGLFRHRQDPRK